MPKWNSKWQVIYNKKRKKYELITKKVSPSEYVFYSVLNTDIAMELGVAASMIARSILQLYNQLAANQTTHNYVEQWNKQGRNVIVLRGYNHKHLKYLEGEAKFLAVDTNALYQRGHGNRIMLVLSVFGRMEEIYDIFDGLSYLR